jgi:hypothetical protein
MRRAAQRGRRRRGGQPVLEAVETLPLGPSTVREGAGHEATVGTHSWRWETWREVLTSKGDQWLRGVKRINWAWLIGKWRGEATASQRQVLGSSLPWQWWKRRLGGGSFGREGFLYPEERESVERGPHVGDGTPASSRFGGAMACARSLVPGRYRARCAGWIKSTWATIQLGRAQSPVYLFSIYSNIAEFIKYKN